MSIQNWIASLSPNSKLIFAIGAGIILYAFVRGAIYFANKGAKNLPKDLGPKKDPIENLKELAGEN